MTSRGLRWKLGALLLCGLAAARAQPRSEAGMDGFAWDLYRDLAAREETFVVSPFSIESALAMTAEGARGETAVEMGKVLAQDPADWTPLHARLGGLAERLAPRPVPAAVAKEIAALKSQLDAANAGMEASTKFDGPYRDLGERAQRLADEINRLQAGIDPTEFRSANALWLDRGFTPEAAFLETLARHHRTGGARHVDFRGDADGARGTINDWVAEQTRDRIRDLLPPGTVDAGTRLVLTNAVYFLAEWLEPFDAGRTRTEKFTLRDGAQIDARLMRDWKSDGVKYAAFEADGTPFATPVTVQADGSDGARRYPERGFQLLELPYRGGAWSMQVLLPLPDGDLAAVEAMLDAAHFRQWTAALAAREVDVALPKFRLEFGTELSPPLQRLGMRRAFVNPALDGGAQFDGISAAADPAQRVYIGNVIHKAFVQVDEKGTEAAAATAISMVAGSALPVVVKFTPVFRADRPFVFVIRENASGTVVFVGRVLQPQSP